MVANGKLTWCVTAGRWLTEPPFVSMLISSSVLLRKIGAKGFYSKFFLRFLLS